MNKPKNWKIFKDLSDGVLVVDYEKKIIRLPKKHSKVTFETKDILHFWIWNTEKP